MKQTLYKIWFSDRHTDNIYASGPLDAVILAQARAIKNEQKYSVDYVRNEETGEAWRYSASKIEAIQ